MKNTGFSQIRCKGTHFSVFAHNISQTIFKTLGNNRYKSRGSPNRSPLPTSGAPSRPPRGEGEGSQPCWRKLHCQVFSPPDGHPPITGKARANKWNQVYLNSRVQPRLGKANLAGEGSPRGGTNANL